MTSAANILQSKSGSAGRARRSFYDVRDGLTPVGRLCLMFAAAAGIGLCSRITVPLPFTPVPLSLQTFGAAVAAVSMGRGWGTASVAVYVACVALGVPWTVSGAAGPAVFTGPTGGYLLGFILAGAALNFFIADPARRGLFTLWGTVLACDIVFVLTPGTLLMWSLFEHSGQPLTLMEAAGKGFFPFIVADIAKSGLAAGFICLLGRR
ncbi:MAG: biotin transporter BioY [Desulfovibrio sp.]|jgi:biotin transport system substrate-specific component|nr:biotin transporter BioY [Desulfovibrio sp.]